MPGQPVRSRIPSQPGDQSAGHISLTGPGEGHRGAEARPRADLAAHLPLGEDGDSEFGDLIEDSEAIQPGEAVSFTLLQEQLHSVLDTLSEREAGVVSMRFGLTDGQPKTLDEIGKVYGVTRERIRQIESKTMSKLRHTSRQHAGQRPGLYPDRSGNVADQSQAGVQNRFHDRKPGWRGTARCRTELGDPGRATDVARRPDLPN
jgi:RNA polymerase sigma factor (sigma-70 family)